MAEFGDMDLDFLCEMLDGDEDVQTSTKNTAVLSASSTCTEVQNWLLLNGFDHIQDKFKNKDGLKMLRYTEAQLVAAFGPLDGSDLYLAIHPEASSAPRVVPPPSSSSQKLSEHNVPKPTPQQKSAYSSTSGSLSLSTPASKSRLALAMQGKSTFSSSSQRSHKTSVQGAPRTQRSKPAVSKPSPRPVATFRPTEDEFTESISGIRVENRKIGAVDLKRMVEGIKFIPLPSLTKYVDRNEIDIDYIVAGVVCSKQEPRHSKNGAAYLILQLNDMRGTQISVFFFGDAFQTHKRIEEGSLIFIQNAKLVPRGATDSYRKDAGIALSINDGNQLLNIGRSKDMGYCQAYRKGKRTHRATDVKCNDVINVTKGDKCDFHLKEAYKTAFASRPDVNKTRIKSDALFGRAQTKQKHLSGDAKFQVGGKSVRSVTSIPGSAEFTGNRSHRNLEAFQNARGMSQQAMRRQHLEKLRRKQLAEEDRQKTMSYQERMRDLREGAKRATSKKRTATQAGFPMANARTISSFELAQKSGKFADGTSSRLSYVRNQATAAERGISHGIGSNLQSTHVSRVQQAQRAAAELLAKQNKKIKRPDPNVPSSNSITYDGPSRPVSKLKRSTVKAPSQQRAQSAGKINPSSSSSSSSQQSAKALRGDDTFEMAASTSRWSKSSADHVDLNDPEVQKLLNAKSRNADVHEREQDAKLRSKWDALEAQEAIEDRLAEKQSDIVTVFKCTKCNVIREYPSDICKQNNHKLEKCKITKRAFECSKCGKRTFTLGKKLPTQSCKKCGEKLWKKTSMMFLNSRKKTKDRELKVNPFFERQSLRTT